jgi:hypothetical protein
VDDEEREHRLATDPALAAEADPVDGA